MAVKSKFTLLPVLFFGVLLLSGTTYAQGEEVLYGYEQGSPTGPEHWGELNFPNWTTCGEGMMQSPIDIQSNNAIVSPLLGRLQRNYKPANAILRNRGHDISVEWTEDAGYITIGNTKYSLIQSHWHIPSEHRLNSKSYNMEMHMVHRSVDGRIAVIGILYKLGLFGDKFLGKQVTKILYLAINRENTRSVNAGVVDPYDVGIGSSDSYFRYNGSLTTPPCTEGVVWTVMQDVRSVDLLQILTLQSAVDPGYQRNARPIQPINGRGVLLYK